MMYAHIDPVKELEVIGHEIYEWNGYLVVKLIRIQDLHKKCRGHAPEERKAYSDFIGSYFEEL